MKRKWLLTLCGLALWLAACATAPTPVPTKASSVTPTVAPPAAPVEVTVIMGYIPHIQFAPWFVAERKGYFAAAGVKVNYTWGFEIDGLKLLGANQADFAMLGGDQVIQARAQNIPLVYVAT